MESLIRTGPPAKTGARIFFYGMPGIGRVFAMPKIKKYPHRILLGDDEHLLDRYPEQKGKLTVFDFNPDGTITAIRFLDPEKDLDKLFP